MSESRIDAETLAAFLDQRLDSKERARVLRILADHPEEYEAFADAASAVAALEGVDRPEGLGATITPISAGKRRRRGWLRVVPLLVAAGIATVVLAPGIRARDEFLPTKLTQRLALSANQGSGSLEARLGVDWDQPGWSITRGGEAGTLTPAHMFRIGTRATDVEVAIRVSDSAALRVVGVDLQELLSVLDGGAATAAQYRRIVTAGASAGLTERQEAAQRLRALLGKSPWFDLGAWAEAARLAVTAEDREFLTRHVGALDVLIKKIGQEPLGTAAVVLMREIRAGISAVPASKDLSQVKELLGQLMVTAGG